MNTRSKNQLIIIDDLEIPEASSISNLRQLDNIIDHLFNRQSYLSGKKKTLINADNKAEINTINVLLESYEEQREKLEEKLEKNAELKNKKKMEERLKKSEEKTAIFIADRVKRDALRKAIRDKELQIEKQINEKEAAVENKLKEYKQELRIKFGINELYDEKKELGYKYNQICFNSLCPHKYEYEDEDDEDYQYTPPLAAQHVYSTYKCRRCGIEICDSRFESYLFRR